MCNFDVMGNLKLINRNLTPHLCIGDMTFMDNTEGIKNRPSRLWNQYTVVQIQQHFEIMSFHFTDAAKCLH